MSTRAPAPVRAIAPYVVVILGLAVLWGVPSFAAYLLTGRAS